jgi:hypothetical protein
MSSMSEAFLAAAEAEANTPIAVGVSARNGCDHTYLINEDRIDYFQSRVAELGKNPAAVVVVVINVDEPSGFGRNLAESLMPGADWQSMRDLGQVPVRAGPGRARRHRRGHWEVLQPGRRRGCEGVFWRAGDRRGPRHHSRLLIVDASTPRG